MSIPVIQGNQGKLNKDNEPAYVTQGDYLDAENVRYFTTDGQTDGSHENVVGNSYAFDLGSVAPSTKGYKICGIGTLAGTGTGWNYFGTPLSQLMTAQQTYDPHIIEDTITPGDIWMSVGYNIWKYDVGAGTWTEMSTISPNWVVDTGVSFKSVRLTQSAAGTLACIYVKDFGSGNRYVVKEWNGAAWISLTGANGFEAAQGYSFGNHPTFPYLAYFDPSIKYDSTGDLYMYMLGVHYDPTQPATSIFRNNTSLPRVFKYNGATWDYLSGVFSVWPGGPNASWGALTGPNKTINIGNIEESGTNLIFPMVYFDNNIPGVGFPYELEPYVAIYDISTNQWSPLMSLTATRWTLGGRLVESGTFNPTTNNITSWAEPTVRVVGSDVYLSFGARWNAATQGYFFVYKSVGLSTTWTSVIDPNTYSPALPTLGYASGKVSMVVNGSGDIFLMLPDKSQLDRLTPIKYDAATSTLSLLDVQGITTDPVFSLESDLLLTSTGDLYVAYSDYATASGFPNFVGVPSVQIYNGGGGAYQQDFTFTYGNGVSIGSITGVQSVNNVVLGLATLFPASQYDVQINISTNANGSFCIEFFVTPLYALASSLLGGFNYYVTTPPGGLFTVTNISDPVPAAEAGPLNVIGSYNILNDLFILSTPNNSPISSVNEYLVQFASVGPYGLELRVAKGTDLISDGAIRLRNTISSQEYSGDHVCIIDTTSPSFDTVLLPGYFPTAVPPSDIYVRAISFGAAEIGVAIKDENLSEQLPPASPWTYTRLLRYYALGLSTLNQADMIAEINNRGVSIYWVDNLNVPRAFYYYGPYIQDGGYNTVNPLNKYDRNQLISQLELQKPYSGAFVDYGGQGNGSLLCGNYRYSVRFVTTEGVATSWTPLSNPFSVYPVETDPYKVYGGDENTVSGKSNILDITWPTANLYEYIEIAYTRTIPGGGGSPTSLFSLEQINFARLKLQNNQVTLTYEHTGDEINVNNIPDGELGAIPFRIKRAKNVRALDNRLVLSNVDVGYYEADLFDMFDSLTYRLEKKAIPVIGTYSPDDLRQYMFALGQPKYANTKSATIGEYMLPENVFYFTGYMNNERYRFYGVAEFLDGSLSDAYFLFDVKFDLNGPTANDPKRITGLSDFNLNDPKVTCLDGNVYVPYLRVVLPPILPSISGKPASTVVRRIHIYRENVSKRTIIANGVGILGHRNFDHRLLPTVEDGVIYQKEPNAVSPWSTVAIKAVRSVFPAYHNDPIISLTRDEGAEYCPFPIIVDRVPDSVYSGFLYQILEQQPIGAANTYYDIGFVSTTIGINTYRWPYQKRDLVTFYSPDFSITDYRIDDVNLQADFMLNYGHYDNYYSGSYPFGVGVVAYNGSMGFGSMYVNSYGQNAPQSISLSTNILDGPVYWTEDGGTAKINDLAVVPPLAPAGYKTYSKSFRMNWLENGNYHNKWLIMPKGYAFVTSSNVSPLGVDTTTPGKDYGIYHMSYGRNLTAAQQYGLTSFGRPVPTGAFIDLQTLDTQLAPIGANPPANTIDVFGGDTFTSKAILKYLYGDQRQDAATIAAGGGGNGSHWGDGIEYYCQSYVNHQLRYNPDTATPQTNFIWPNDFNNPQAINNYKDWFTKDIEDVAYNSSYSDKNAVNISPVFDPDLYYDSRLPATIFYSEPKLQESLVDSYSYIKASNRKDLDISLGPINHHEIMNGELYTFQEKAFQRQYFNTTAMFADATSQIVIGDGGAVLRQKGNVISTMGLVNKWAAIKGRSMGGNDVLYWFDAINKRIMRFGADGVVPISSRGSIDSFLANYTNYVQLYDTPANDMGVHGVWDESNREVIWTFRVRKTGLDYDTVNGPVTGYNTGDVVYYNANIANENYEWHQTGEFWVSQDNANVALPSQIPPGPGVPPSWIHIPHTDSKYYNEFTICYSEDKNGFTTFYSFKPKIYLQYKDRYLSPRPIFPQGHVYEHNFGARCIWYTGSNHFDPINDATALKQEAFIEGVVNYNPEMVKTAEALSIDAYLDPNVTGIERVEVRTKDHNTFMLGPDFNYAETMFRSPIKNDTQGGTVSPDSDTSRPYGRWIAMKFVMDWGYLQSIRSFVMKVRERARMYNR